MNIRTTTALLISIAALQMGAAASAQKEPEKRPGVVVFQDPNDAPGNPKAPAEQTVDPNDPRPVILQSQGALLFMLMNNMPADTFRGDLDAYNAKYPAPAKAKLAAAINELETGKAAANSTCVPKTSTKFKVSSSTAAPVIRQYIASKEITNAWIVTHTPKGCGKLPANVYTVAQRMDGTLLPIRMGTGETLINLNIHYDLSKVLADNLLKFYATKKVDCEGQRISPPDMRIVSQSGDWGKEFYGTYLSGKWREEWTFTGCGGTAVIPIDLEWKGATNTEYLVQFPEATFTPDS
ncbi:MAG: hypothetical protein ABJP34_00625 [Erythrobacter sp.]